MHQLAVAHLWRHPEAQSSAKMVPWLLSRPGRPPCHGIKSMLDPTARHTAALPKPRVSLRYSLHLLHGALRGMTKIDRSRPLPRYTNRLGHRQTARLIFQGKKTALSRAWRRRSPSGRQKLPFSASVYRGKRGVPEIYCVITFAAWAMQRQPGMMRTISLSLLAWMTGQLTRR